MRRPFKGSILLLVAFLLALFAPEEAERVRLVLADGSTLQVCHFDSLFSADEDESHAPRQPMSGSTAGVVLGTASAAANLGEVYFPASLTRSSTSSAPAYHPALSERVLVAIAPLHRDRGARAVKPRGPPRRRLTSQPTSPRGPPAA